MSDVRDLRVVRNSSGRAQAVRALTASGWKQFPGPAGAHEIQARVDGLRDSRADARRSCRGGSSTAITSSSSGWLRGLGKARLQELTGQGWQTVRHIRPAPSGTVRRLASRACGRRSFASPTTVSPATRSSLQVAPRVSLTRERRRSACACLAVAAAAGAAAHAQPLASRRELARASSTARCAPAATASRCQGGSAYASAVTRRSRVRAASTGP